MSWDSTMVPKLRQLNLQDPPEAGRIYFFKITWTAVDFHSDCYVPVPSHWQYSDVTRRDWPAQIVDNGA